ncbi:cold shock CspA family protein [Bradyrhizobium diazoefficiens]|jgi:cold shock CspA family protein|uniref:cold-shock protein n=1 Tax=Bradyrhizobium TaxID=374 RepID=UPI000D72FF63|nr:cold shock domain-containing protein [Bradyrhizobium diazoefficiens]MBP1060181.1 cold shock CspA family protein [Bradyrhizobium japonicum]
MLATVVTWFDDHSFGFAKPDTLTFDVFLHRSSLLDAADHDRLHVGQRISLDLAPAAKRGMKPRAARVTILGDAAILEPRSRPTKAKRLKN